LRKPKSICPYPVSTAIHFGGAVLQHAIAEASGGCADVETDFIVEIDVPVLESLL